MRLLLGLLVLLVGSPLSAQYRAGVARVKITPQTPVWLSGFAARTRPAEAVAQDLWAKVLAIEDASGSLFVLVTADIIGFTREITDEIALRAAGKYKLQRRQILFNASHTHSGPSIWPRLHVAPSTGPEVDQQIRAYAERLVNDIDAAVGRALSGMQPAHLTFAEARANFASNRRIEQLASLQPGKTFPAPVDQSVPVLRVATEDAKTLAIVFGYACHNTVLTSEFNDVSGDYAGHAQVAIEANASGATAMFVSLCAGDQRPTPRGKRELAEQHGKTVAGAVASALQGRAQPITGAIHTAYHVTAIPFQVHTRETFVAESKSADPFLARRGRIALEALDAKRPITETPFAAQAVRFGSGRAWVALAGEVVIDYQLRLKAEFGADRVVVLGYSNDVMGYIPSKRVQREGGYEAGDALMYFSQPGWFTEEVEDIVTSAARKVLAEVGLRPAQKPQTTAR
ncbi:MAG TPA: neutral/alkaline non-lysosomal ceramidase N-terminal domain-containing protein [Bryobacteraceae bacterium]|nr:neutral/alkaline non-lysosomal ceramidase N-terminal domain-containing protein [Bryobacteraceae bacterium]